MASNRIRHKRRDDSRVVIADARERGVRHAQGRHPFQDGGKSALQFLSLIHIFVDEAHYYKNLFFHTKMRNVSGIAQSEAMKSSDLFMKCRRCV